MKEGSVLHYSSGLQLRNDSDEHLEYWVSACEKIFRCGIFWKFLVAGIFPLFKRIEGPFVAVFVGISPLLNFEKFVVIYELGKKGRG